MDYFQDDLFPETRSPLPLYGSSEWFEAKVDKPVVLVSLCPPGMTALSVAPALELTDRQKTYNAHLAKKDEVKAKGILGHESSAEVATHFQGVAAAGISSYYIISSPIIVSQLSCSCFIAPVVHISWRGMTM